MPFVRNFFNLLLSGSVHVHLAVRYDIAFDSILVYIDYSVDFALCGAPLHPSEQPQQSHDEVSAIQFARAVLIIYVMTVNNCRWFIRFSGVR
eukprot:4409862-Amphidinium_carterae.1